MSEDLTRNLPDTFQERVLAEFAALNNRLDSIESRLDSVETRLDSVENRLIKLEDRALSIDTRLISLEDKVDARLRETRPVWEGVLQRLTQIEKSMDTLAHNFKTMVVEEFNLRVRVEKLEDDRHAV